MKLNISLTLKGAVDPSGESFFQCADDVRKDVELCASWPWQSRECLDRKVLARWVTVTQLKDHTSKSHKREGWLGEGGRRYSKGFPLGWLLS